MGVIKTQKTGVEPQGAKPLTLSGKPCLAGAGISRLEKGAAKAEDLDL